MIQQHVTLKVAGMDCAECALKLEKGVGQLPGVASCDVSFATTRLDLTFDPAVVDLDQVARRVRAMGYGITLPGGVEPEEASPQLAYLLRHRSRELATAMAGLAIALAATTSLAGLPAPLSDALYALAIASGGLPIARKAISSVRYNHELDMNVLMSIAVLGAAAIGQWAEGAMVVFLFSLGELLEGYTMDRARQAIRGLMALAPAEATVLRPCLDCAGHLGQPQSDGQIYQGGPCPWCEPQEMRVPVAELAIDETILIKPGERIAMDSVVISGQSAVDQAAITGESMPVDKSPGDDLYAGTVNGSGALTARVSRLSTDNTISRIIQMVEAAQAQRAPVQRWVDRFARIYTPAVVLVALAVAVLPPLLFSQPLLSQGDDTGWLYRSLALLVIACPCALVISTPVSIASAIAAAASHGVLIKGGAYLEAMAGVRAIAFDKTGTLTMGQPALTAVQCANHVSPGNGAACPACDEVLTLAAALERRSEHPLARAVVQGAQGRRLQYPAAEEVQVVAGRGVWGRVNGLELGISSHRHAHELELCDAPEFCQAVFERETSGQTTMILHDASALRGYLAVADQVRQESAAMAAALHAAGVERLVMLTGDNELTAQAIGTLVGIDEVQANLLPQEKVDAIRQLQRRYGSVAMVGDGVNDTPALAAADVGIAMGAAGTDQALETADIALMDDGLSKLPFTVHLSHSARSIIFQNIAFALAIKAAFIVLAMTGVATLWMAVFADVGASLIVILNGMRLLRSRPDHGHAPDASPTAQRTVP